MIAGNEGKRAPVDHVEIVELDPVGRMVPGQPNFVARLKGKAQEWRAALLRVP